MSEAKQTATITVSPPRRLGAFWCIVETAELLAGADNDSQQLVETCIVRLAATKENNPRLAFGFVENEFVSRDI